MQARARALARVIRRLARGEAVPLDLQLEPSNMTRGMSHARRRRLEARLRSGALTLTEPASSSGG
jgi:hypothetical protein